MKYLKSSNHNDDCTSRRRASHNSVGPILIDHRCGQEADKRTRFTDVHGFFQAPLPRPTLHRFDKGSYLYLYRNVDGSGGRLEIANNVGRPEQDAFTGSLSTAVIRYSHKHPTLCSIIVDGLQRHSSASPHADDHQWRLPGGDPRQEWRHASRLHTVDLYLWTDEDAKSFMNCIERTLPAHQIQVLDAPPPTITQDNPSGQGMSHVVQRLEKAAIHDGGQHRGSATASVSPATSASVPGMKGQGQNSPNHEDTTNFQPLAYNPAAPAAPEPIKHREKTPPPVDADGGTGLSAAAQRDHAQAMSPTPVQSQSSLSQSPFVYSTAPHRRTVSPAALPAQPSLPPSAQWLGASSTAAGPRLGSVSSIPSATGQRASSVSSIPPATGQPGHTPYASGTPINGMPERHGSTASSTKPQQSSMSFAPPPPQETANPPGSEISFAPPPQDLNRPIHGEEGAPLATPTTEILRGSYIGSPPQPLQHLQPRYADYLGQQPHPQHPAASEHPGYDPRDQRHHGHHVHRTDTDASDIHNQFYVPDEHEGRHHRPSDASSQSKVNKIDKLGNRFLKKLEKNFG